MFFQCDVFFLYPCKHSDQLFRGIPDDALNINQGSVGVVDDVADSRIGLSYSEKEGTPRQTAPPCVSICPKSFGNDSISTGSNEFYAIAFRKKIYTSIEQLQAHPDAWMNSYNTQKTHPSPHANFYRRNCRGQILMFFYLVIKT